MSNKKVVTLDELRIFADELNQKVESATDLEVRRLLRKKYKITVNLDTETKEHFNVEYDKYYYPQEGLVKIVVIDKNGDSLRNYVRVEGLDWFNYNLSEGDTVETITSTVSADTVIDIYWSKPI